MTFLLWASFIVCAVVGILAMGIIALALRVELMERWIRYKRFRKAFLDFVWYQREKERAEKRGAES